MSAIKKGMINWANVKTGKKQQRENDGTGFSLHLEAACWNGKHTGAPPSERSARPPKDLAAAARAQTRGGLGALGCSQHVASRDLFSHLPVRASTGNIDAVVKVPTGSKHDASIELVKEALETARLHEQIHGPWKMKTPDGKQIMNGVLVVRVKSKLQYEHIKTALREIEDAMGLTCVFPDPAWSGLPAFKPQKITVVPVAGGEHVRADGATYNMRSFLGVIGFEWRRADNFARKFVKERHWHEPDGTRPWMPYHKGQAKGWEWQRAREKGLYKQGPRLLASTIAYNVERPFGDQERLTEQDKADRVPGCWLIIEAQGEKLKEAMQNLEGLCEHWGWELQDPNLIT